MTGIFFSKNHLCQRAFSRWFRIQDLCMLSEIEIHMFASLFFSVLNFHQKKWNRLWLGWRHLPLEMPPKTGCPQFGSGHHDHLGWKVPKKLSDGAFQRQHRRSGHKTRMPQQPIYLRRLVLHLAETALRWSERLSHGGGWEEMFAQEFASGRVVRG